LLLPDTLDEVSAPARSSVSKTPFNSSTYYPSDIEIARQRLSGKAVLFEGDSEALREGVRRFISALPRDAEVYGLQLDEERNFRESSLTSIAPRLVLVEISLGPL
jgi:hypothetical protein